GGIGLPSRSTKLLINQDAGRRLIELDVLGVPSTKFDEQVKLLRRCCRCRCLCLRKRFLRRAQGSLCFGGILFPESPFLLATLRFLSDHPCIGFDVAASRDDLPEVGKLLRQFFRRFGGRDGWYER